MNDETWGNIASVVFAISILLFTGCSLGKGVKIDPKHFPDKDFRNLVSSGFDEDENGYLSDEEIQLATVVNVHNSRILMYHEIFAG